jgi:hypothetical protein
MARSGRATGGADEGITLPEPADAREVNVATPLDRYNQSGQRNSEIILPMICPDLPLLIWINAGPLPLGAFAVRLI